jgi:hypothetical protein
MKARTSWFRFPFFFCLSFLVSLIARGQDAHIATPDPGQISFVNFDPAKDVFTMSGSRISTIDLSGVNGSPYLLPYYVKGTVVFVNGKVFRDGLLQFNLVSNQLQFLNNGRPLSFAQPVRYFTLVDTTGDTTKTAWFNSGYPQFGMHNQTTFYQVLAIGTRIQLLKYISKHTTEQYQYSTLPKLFFKQTEDLILYDQQSQDMFYITNSAGSVEKALEKINPKSEQVMMGIKKKKLSEDEIIAIVNKVNSL